jgi:hypothetical protein
MFDKPTPSKSQLQPALVSKQLQKIRDLYVDEQEALLRRIEKLSVSHRKQVDAKETLEASHVYHVVEKNALQQHILKLEALLADRAVEKKALYADPAVETDARQSDRVVENEASQDGIALRARAEENGDREKLIDVLNNKLFFLKLTTATGGLLAVDKVYKMLKNEHNSTDTSESSDATTDNSDSSALNGPMIKKIIRKLRTTFTGGKLDNASET